MVCSCTCTCLQLGSHKPHSYQFIYSRRIHSVKQVNANRVINVPLQLFKNCLLSMCVYCLVNVHTHPHADFPVRLGNREREDPPQTSARSWLPRTACSWAASLDLTGDQWLPAPLGAAWTFSRGLSGPHPHHGLRL